MLHPEVFFRRRPAVRRRVVAWSIIIASAIVNFVLVMMWLEHRAADVGRLQALQADDAIARIERDRFHSMFPGVKRQTVDSLEAGYTGSTSGGYSFDSYNQGVVRIRNAGIDGVNGSSQSIPALDCTAGAILHNDDHGGWSCRSGPGFVAGDVLTVAGVSELPFIRDDSAGRALFSCYRSESACAVCTSYDSKKQFAYTCDARARRLAVYYDGTTYFERPQSAFWSHARGTTSYASSSSMITAGAGAR